MVLSLLGPAELSGLMLLRSFMILAVEIPNSSMTGLGLRVPGWQCPGGLRHNHSYPETS